MNPASFWLFQCSGSSNSQRISAAVVVSASPDAVNFDLASSDSILRENVSLVSEENIETLAARDPFKVQIMLAAFCAQISLMEQFENWISDGLPVPSLGTPPAREPDDRFDCGIDVWIVSAAQENHLASSVPASPGV